MTSGTVVPSSGLLVAGVRRASGGWSGGRGRGPGTAAGLRLGVGIICPATWPRNPGGGGWVPVTRPASVSAADSGRAGRSTGVAWVIALTTAPRPVAAEICSHAHGGRSAAGVPGMGSFHRRSAMTMGPPWRVPPAARGPGPPARRGRRLRYAATAARVPGRKTTGRWPMVPGVAGEADRVQFVVVVAVVWRTRGADVPRVGVVGELRRPGHPSDVPTNQQSAVVADFQRVDVADWGRLRVRRRWGCLPTGGPG